MKVVSFIFYAGLALFFFGVAFPALKIIIAICALVIAISHVTG